MRVIAVLPLLTSFLLLGGSAATEAASAPLFRLPSGVAIDTASHLYIASQRNHTIQKVSLSGRLLASWAIPFSRPAGREWPHAVGADGKGNVYALVSGSENANSVLKISPRGRVLARWSSGFPRTASGALGLAVDAEGNSFVLFRVEKPSSAPAGSYKAEIVRLSPRGKRTGLFIINVPGYAGTYPGAIAVDRAGKLYLLMVAVNDCPSMHEDCRQQYTLVETLSSRGRVLAQWHTQDRPALNAESVTVDSKGNLYLGAVGWVEKLSSRFRPLARWQVNGCGIAGPISGVAVDGRGNVYASTFHGDDPYGTVQKLSPTGALLGVWGNCA